MAGRTIELERFGAGTGALDPGVVGPPAAGMGPGAILDGRELAGTGAGVICTGLGPTVPAFALVWSAAGAPGTEALDRGAAAGRSAPSPPLGDAGAMPRGAAAPLQLPSVSILIIAAFAPGEINVATIPRRLRGTTPQSLGLPGFSALRAQVKG